MPATAHPLRCPTQVKPPRRSPGKNLLSSYAEGAQFSDVVADLAFRVGSGGVVVRAEVDELGFVVGQQSPDDDENRAADRDDRSLLAAAAGDPPIALAEEGVGA